MMLTIRGVYDGQTFRPLPSEPVPEVEREVAVAIVFLEEVGREEGKRQRQREIAQRMLTARDAMEPLGMSVAELIEEGRER